MTTSDSTTRRKHWSRIKALSATWLCDHRPHGATKRLLADAESRLQTRVPAALREFHEVFGGDLEPWSVQDHLWAASRWHVTEQGLVIAMENQGNHDWVISEGHFSMDDPPVFITDVEERSRLHPSAQTLTDFAELWVLLTAKFSQKSLFRANGQVPAAVAAALRMSYRELYSRPFRWPSYPTELRGDRDVILELNENEWVWLTARDEDSFRRAIEIGEAAGMDWDVQDTFE
jgi:hypothetical protein